MRNVIFIQEKNKMQIFYTESFIDFCRKEFDFKSIYQLIQKVF